jgi:AhpD family alkylhydroperoxidase
VIEFGHQSRNIDQHMGSNIAERENTLYEKMRMKPFKRRIYHGLGELLTDVRIIMSHRREIRTLMQGTIIAPAFRERLMLVVTAVNRCRYCSYAHAREALSNGIPEEEIDALSQGMFTGSPPDEVPAMLYAQHWAESNGEPEPTARQQVVAQYGEQAVEMMELAFRMIRAGNLSGNTFDYVLYRISWGRWGAKNWSGQAQEG